jgi:serine/threonine protein phosphatase PrpC
MQVIKTEETPLTEELVFDLVDKFIFCPDNLQMARNEQGDVEEVNAWFGGFVYGYEKAILFYDYATNEKLEEPKVFFNLLLSDGLGYVLSKTKCVIHELTEEEYNEKLADFEMKQIMQNVKEDNTNVIDV